MIFRFSFFFLTLVIRLTFGIQILCAQEIDSSKYKVWKYNLNYSHEFLNEAQFERSLFLGKVDFWTTTFQGYTSFRFAHFDSKAGFEMTVFRKNEEHDAVDFEGAKFFSYAAFIGTKFYIQPAFINSEFCSYADFSGSSFYDWAFFRSAYFDSEVDFKETQFIGPAVFSDTHFDSVANFNKVRFCNESDFSGAYFKFRADFSNALFIPLNKGYYQLMVSFNNVDFKSEVFFKKAHFGYTTYFTEVNFDSLSDFTGAKFDSTANFSRAYYRSKANFNDVDFNSVTVFNGAKFISKADFNRSFFKSNFSLKNVVFGSNGSFSNAEFRGEVLLDSCLLPDTLYFNSVETEKEIDFTYAQTDTLQQTNKKCIIDLYGTDIQKLKFDYSRFKILRDSSKYNKSQLSNIYQQLLKMQRDKGFIDGEEDVDKEYRHFKLTYDKAGFAYLIGALGSWVQRMWWDYGYHKERVVLWILGFLSVFTFLNAWYFKCMNEKVYPINSIYQMKGNSSRANFENGVGINKWVYKIWKSTFIKAFLYTSLIFFGLRLHVDKIHFKHPGSIYLIIQYTVGLVCLAYLANFIILS